MNIAVRTYLKRFDKELYDMTVAPIVLQKRIFADLFTSRHNQFLWAQELSASEENYERFNRTCPLTNYDDCSGGIERLMSPSCPLTTEYFAQSAGTTSSVRKLVPTTEHFVRINHLRASWYILHTLFRHRPSISIFNRKNLLVGGSIYERKQRYMVGDVSGIMLYRIPFFFRPFCLPGINTAILSDWKTKIQRTAAIAARTKNVSLIAGTPTWILAVIKEVLNINKDQDINSLWPAVECLVHGGISFTPYRHQFEQLFDNSDLSFLETYNASEGFFGFQNELEDPSLLLMIANGIFYEFVPLDEYKKGHLEAIPLWEVKTDIPYVMVVSTVSGLMRYIVGDVVRFTNTMPYKLLISGRITDYINAFGEDLLLNQAEEAITRTSALFDVDVVHYTIAPSYLSLQAKGCHEWYIEFETPPANPERFAECLDSMLRNINSNYDQKRQGNLAMEQLRLMVVPPGGFENYLISRNALHGQAKVPRLRNDRHLADDLNRLIRNHNGVNKRTGTVDLWNYTKGSH